MSSPTTPFDAQLETALRVQANRLAIYLIKYRARAYARRPLTLDNVFPGLSCATPDAMIAIAKHAVKREAQAPRRWFGFGSEAPALNARAVLLIARTLRRAARR